MTVELRESCVFTNSLRRNLSTTVIRNNHTFSRTPKKKKSFTLPVSNSQPDQHKSDGGNAHKTQRAEHGTRDVPFFLAHIQKAVSLHAASHVTHSDDGKQEADDKPAHEEVRLPLAAAGHGPLRALRGRRHGGGGGEWGWGWMGGWGRGGLGGRLHGDGFGGVGVTAGWLYWGWGTSCFCGFWIWDLGWSGVAGGIFICVAEDRCAEWGLLCAIGSGWLFPLLRCM